MFSKLDKKRQFKGLLDLPGIASRTIALAVLVQNAMHPKNSQRVESIKAGEYKEIKTQEQAEEYLADVLRKNMRTELQGIESEVKAQFDSLASAKDLDMIINSPDAFYAAAVLT